jgi:tetratricopeptide (TPR) repeat protein
MSSTGAVNRVAATILVLSFIASAGLLYAIDHVQRGPALPDALYLQSPKLLKRLSLGYAGLLADVYWTRAVQYFGYQHHEHSNDFHLLAPLLKIAVELDPKLVPAYQFGSNFLSPKPPNGAGEPEKALELATYGVQHNPDQWRLYYNLGFLYYTEFHDYAKAADAFSRGAQLPVTNEFMPILAARMAQHAGEYGTAKMLWFTTYQSTKEPQIQKNAVDHLKALRVDEDVTQLEKLVERYSHDHGQLPKSISELETAGYIRGTPIDPNGHPYRLMGEGRIEVEDPDSLLYITKGLPPGMEPPQPKGLSK